MFTPVRDVSRSLQASRVRWIGLALLTCLLVLGSFGVPVPADAAKPFGGTVIQVNSAGPQVDEEETTVAINPTNPRNLIAGSIDNVSSCAAYHSTDRGKTWSDQLLPAPPGFTTAGDPWVAFGPDGTAYYLCMYVTAAGMRTQMVHRSTDGGQFWSNPPEVAMGASGANVDDRGMIITDDRPGSPYLGNVYVTATRNPGSPGDLLFARSTSGATSFDPEIKVNDAPIGFAANMAVGADGAVYVAWGQVVGGQTIAIMIDKSTNGGASFGALTGGTDHLVRYADIVDNNETRAYPERGNGFPSIGAHPTNPNIVYATWAEDPPGIDDSDIMFSRSQDGGNNWEPPIRVNDDVNPPGDWFGQFWPTIAVDPTDGGIDLVWYSDQNDPNLGDGTSLVDLYFTTSTNGGQSFAPSIRVTPASSTSSTPAPFEFFGDYIGLDALGGVAHAVWADTTLGGEGDIDVATTQIGGADLVLSVTDDPDPVVAGTNLKLTVDVTNDGPADALNAYADVFIPNHASFVSHSGGCTWVSPGPLVCDLGDLQPGDKRTFEVRVHIDRDTVYQAGGATSILHSFFADSDQDDPDLSTNHWHEETQVVAETDLAVSGLSALNAPTELGVGDSVPVTLRTSMTNGGPSGPTDVDVSTTGAASGTGTIAPASSSSSESAVDLGHARVIDHKYTIGCSGPGTAAFDFSTLVQPTTPGTTDPDMSDNTEAEQLTLECIQPVKINIRPGSSENVVNLSSSGVIPVAILTTAAGDYGLPSAFDATTVDATTIRFGPEALVNGGGGASETHGEGHPEDSYELDETTQDGDLDLVTHFLNRETGLSPGDTEACVRGTFLGEAGQTLTFFGCDTVQVSGT